MTKIAFIGLGTMGLGMARNLIRKGHDVTGYDPSPAAMDGHVRNGGQAAPSPAEAARGAEVVFTILPNGGVVRRALFDEGGVVHGIAGGALVIDMSTISPAETDGIRADLAAKGVQMVDAPVGRTSDDAKAGTSLFMVGAESADLERARPLLECLGTATIDCGGPGTGTRMKIVNNLMSTTLNVLTAQILTFSDATGLDRNIAMEVMSGTPAGRGHMSTTYPAKVLKGDLSAAFMIDLAKKDLDIALDLSKELGVPLTLSATAGEVYVEAQKAGRGGQDWTAIFDMLQKAQFPTA